MRNLLLVTVLLLTSTVALSKVNLKVLEQSMNKVIYGVDNRNDIYESNNASFKRVAASTVALIKKNKLEDRDGVISITSLTTVGSAMNLCKEEPYFNQPSPAFCSGFLVAPNKIVTAGHCITNKSDCSNVSFVFDFDMKNANEAKTKFSKDDIYYCKKIVARKLQGTGADWGVIELDRPVVGRTALKLRQSGKPSKGTPLVVIGHPSGLPTKIADGANVRTVYSSRGYFVANLDTYGGNSGSAVFNSDTLEVEGILVRGDRDYVYDYSNWCYKSNLNSNNGGRGEDVTLIKAVNRSVYGSVGCAKKIKKSNLDAADGLFEKLSNEPSFAADQNFKKQTIALRDISDDKKKINEYFKLVGINQKNPSEVVAFIKTKDLRPYAQTLAKKMNLTSEQATTIVKALAESLRSSLR